MEDTPSIIIDNKTSQIIRSYKENDQLFYSYGVDNIIFGITLCEGFNAESFKSIIPVGMDINGIVAVYNENTYEDFETLLNDEIEKIKNDILKDSEVKLIGLAVKELLYLDDFETMEFEYKTYGGNSEVQVEFVSNAIDALNKNYFFIMNRCEVFFRENAIDKAIDFPYDDIDSLKQKGLFANIITDNESLMIDNVGCLSEENITHLTSFIDKLNISPIGNSNQTDVEFLKCINIQFGYKPGSVLNKLQCKNISIKNYNDNMHIYIDTIGVISTKNKNIDKILILLYDKFIQSLKCFYTSLNDNTTLIQTQIVYNALFTPNPFIVTSHTQYSKEDNVLTINNKTIINESDLLHNTYYIKGLSFFNLSPFKETKYTSTQLVSPHLIIDKPISNEYTVHAFVRGKYEYFHYNQQGINDAGWGCAYRSLQTVFSWFLLNTNLGNGRQIPTIKEIQTTLVKIGDKEKSLIGSTEWIGVVEVGYVLNELLGIESRTIYVSSGSEVPSKGRELVYHFQHFGCPVMIGGGKFAYTIIGVEYDRVKGECLFLILDPHYGGEDDRKIVCNKGWCNWKTVSLFQKENFYNLCMPIIP